MTPMRKLFIRMVIGTVDRKSNDLLPERALVEHGEQEAEAHQRKQVTQAAARLCHLQLVGSEVDDIAVEKDRHAEQGDQFDADLRGDQLQRERQLPEDDLGNGSMKPR